MKRNKAPYLTLRIAAAHQLLANPTATDAQRCGARRRLNRAVVMLRSLRVSRMKRGLQIDKLPRQFRNRAGVAA